MSEGATEAEFVRRVKRFKRLYDRELGMLGGDLPDSSHSPAEVRVISELARTGEVTATDLREVLRLDAGYLSRILAGLQRSGLVGRRRCPADARRRMVLLTAEGEETSTRIDRQYERQIREVFSGLAQEDRQLLVESMANIEGVLSSEGASRQVTWKEAPGSSVHDRSSRVRRVEEQSCNMELFRVISERRAGTDAVTEATVKLVVEGERLISVAEGSHPLDALERAVRRALEPRFPWLREIQLVGPEENDNCGANAITTEASWRVLARNLQAALGKDNQGTRPDDES